MTMAVAEALAGPENEEAEIDIRHFVRRGPDGTCSLDAVVAGIHCGSCVNRIESALRTQPGVISARANLTSRQLALTWYEGQADAARLLARIEKLGFHAVPLAAERPAVDEQARLLLRTMAVAGFATTNIMMISVAVWSGLVTDMGLSTRVFMHWVSALIALPAVVYAVRPFLASAWSALRARQVNMDVPITLGVLLTTAISLQETLSGGDYVYYDAAVSLLFVLLVGRYLDRVARGRAQSAAEQLVVLQGVVGHVIGPDGAIAAVPARQLVAGMRIRVAPGDRLPADGEVERGESDLDMALVTGETTPVSVRAGAMVLAGTINRTGTLTVRVRAAGEDTTVAEMRRLMGLAEQGRARFVRIADRAARLYAPMVHGLALATFLFWVFVMGMAWQPALVIAVSVLIVTCPCALGLAVPVAQVVAAGALFQRGVLIKAADGLERLAAVDTVVFDKTGTLTTGAMTLESTTASADQIQLAATLAAHSRHPLCRALTRHAPPSRMDLSVKETPGQGLATELAGETLRLGRREWCGVTEAGAASGPELWFRQGQQEPVGFFFQDTLRVDSATVIAALQRAGLAIELLSGDREDVVRAVARGAGILRWEAGVTPAGKVARLNAMAANGHRVLMVGDGLNDAPALATAHASLSPATAADISQAAADAVFQGALLRPVLETIEVARATQRRVRENFAMAAIYNAAAIPLAMAGMVTPLIAALFMAASSLAVTVNALRLRRARRVRA